jgi:hypothetical protein
LGTCIREESNNITARPKPAIIISVFFPKKYN